MILFGFGSALFKGRRMKDLVKFSVLFLGLAIFLATVQSSGEEKDAFALLSSLFFFAARILYNGERLPFLPQQFMVSFTGGYYSLLSALCEVWPILPVFLIPSFLLVVGFVACINDNELMDGKMMKRYLAGLAVLPSLLLLL
jgi:hypothetical protein